MPQSLTLPPLPDRLNVGTDQVKRLQKIHDGLVALNDSAYAEAIRTLADWIENKQPVSPPMPSTAPAQDAPASLRFRENFRTRQVEMQIDNVAVFASDEYRTTAVHAQATYGLSDDKLMEMFRDYKEDYDHPELRSSGPSMG